ncbi:MAG: ATP synthase F0 subunit B [Bdellovibrio sp.]|nr:ATP synthase F0 subunit B [Bdellovibrio sp.]
MRKNILFTATLLLGVVAMAAEAEHGGGHNEQTIPLTEIGWQAANLGILVIALFFFLKKSVVESFAKRRTDFLEQAEKTKAALKLAEDDLRDTKKKLADLESGEAKVLETAKHEANIIKANLIKDAEIQAAKIKTDAEASIKNELMKATAEINAIILAEAVNASKAKLSAGTAQSLQANEAHFLSQVGNSNNVGVQ